jgi:hypothetical protein
VTTLVEVLVRQLLLLLLKFFLKNNIIINCTVVKLCNDKKCCSCSKTVRHPSL